MTQIKTDALYDIIREARADRVTNASVKRTVRGLRTLGFDGEDLVDALDFLEICAGNTGAPRSKLIKRIW